eukprot:30931-Pelagococcus_subviridis.AAC.16
MPTRSYGNQCKENAPFSSIPAPPFVDPAPPPPHRTFGAPPTPVPSSMSAAYPSSNDSSASSSPAVSPSPSAAAARSSSAENAAAAPGATPHPNPRSIARTRAGASSAMRYAAYIDPRAIACGALTSPARNIPNVVATAAP